jgi:hypothetical protein
MDSHDREVLRRLAGRWMELASLPVMAQRKRQWTALKDQRAERPMLLFETWTIEGYVPAAELECHRPDLRRLEGQLRAGIRQVEEIGDDCVLEPHWRLYWEIQDSGYGVPIQAEHGIDESGGQVAYHYNHPIQTPEDIERLEPRRFSVDRERTYRQAEELQALFGDLLPVVVQGTGGFLAALTSDLFRLIGNQNLLSWLYDAPEALHRLMAYLRDDRIACYTWLERQGLLGLNNTWELIGSGSPGYTTALPQPDYAGRPRLKDLWIWIESQETQMISPGMFAEFFLPYLAEVAALFGLVYYGCCEPVHDRWQAIVGAIPQVRAVSVSPWCDQDRIAGMLGQEVIFSRKPVPWFISGEAPDWQALAQDLDSTLAAARDCNLEIIFRDVYRIHGERSRLARWARLVRSRIGA